MNSFFDNTSIIKTLWRRKWHLAVVTVVAALCGFIFSGPSFITPMFKSQAVLYPANGEYTINEGFSEQMVQIMQSQEILDSVIAKFNLYEHYGIKKSTQFNTKMQMRISKLITARKSDNDAVRVVVLDKDPQMAYDIVNEMIRLYQIKFDRFDKDKRSKYIVAMEKTMQQSQRKIDSIKDRMSFIAENYSIYDRGSQTAEVTKADLGTFDGAGRVDKKYAQQLKENLIKYGPELNLLENLLHIEMTSLGNVKMLYDEEMTHYLGVEQSLSVVSAPYVADCKYSPKRSIYVVACGLSAFLLGCLVVVAIEGCKRKENA